MIKRLLISVLCLLSLSARGQDAQTNANELLSDSYIRSAASFMAISQSFETDEAASLAGTLLDAAIELNPGNALAWSMRAELAQASGHQEAYEKALVGYLETGMDDDRARFNLIRYRLGSNNTLDAQLRELEDLLEDTTTRRFSAPLRSRLASLAASMGSELGDERARRRWAVEAARADPANVEAAQTMLDLVIELGGDAVKQGTARVNVIRADPLQPAARLALAGLLAEHGVFGRAAQQYQVVSTRLSAEPLHLSEYTNWAHCLAMSGQDELLLQLLDEFEAALNQPAGEAGVGQDGAAIQQPQAERVELPFSLELIRLAVLHDAEGGQERAKAVLARMDRQWKAEADQLADRAHTAAAEQNFALIAAVFGPDLDFAQAAAERAGQEVALGWVALRRGELEKAQELLTPHANQDPLASCGLAWITGQDDVGKARLLQAFIEAESTTSLATLVAGREMLKAQTPAQPTTTGKALLALMAKYPESFWLVDVERTPWVDIRLKIDPQRIRPLQPIEAEITLWNTSRFPLAIGEQGPINPNALVIVSASSSGRRLPSSSPIVVDLGRRFTLKAGERLIVDARLDYHQFGTIRATNPGVPLAFDARLLLNPSPTPFGTWRPGGIGGLSEVRDSLVQAQPANAERVDVWLADLNKPGSIERFAAFKRLAALNREAQPDLLTPQRHEQVKAQLLDAWAAASEPERAWIILNAVGLDQELATFPELRELAITSRSKFVWLTLMVQHAAEAESQILEAAIGRTDLPEVSSFAVRQGRLLRDYAAFLEAQAAGQAQQQGQ